MLYVHFEDYSTRRRWRYQFIYLRVDGGPRGRIIGLTFPPAGAGKSLAEKAGLWKAALGASWRVVASLKDLGGAAGGLTFAPGGRTGGKRFLNGGAVTAARICSLVCGAGGWGIAADTTTSMSKGGPTGESMSELRVWESGPLRALLTLSFASKRTPRVVSIRVPSWRDIADSTWTFPATSPDTETKNDVTSRALVNKTK